MLFRFSCSITNYFVYYLGIPATLQILFNSGHGIPFSRIFPSLTHTMLLHQVGGREGRGGVLHFTSVIFGSASRYNSFKKYLCILAKSHQNMFPLHRGIRKTRGLFGNINSWCKKLILHTEFAIRIR